MTTSGRRNSTPGQPGLHRAGAGGEEKKEAQRAGVSLSSLRVSMPSRLEDVFYFIF